MERISWDQDQKTNSLIKLQQIERTIQRSYQYYWVNFEQSQRISPIIQAYSWSKNFWNVKITQNQHLQSCWWCLKYWDCYWKNCWSSSSGRKNQTLTSFARYWIKKNHCQVSEAPIRNGWKIDGIFPTITHWYHWSWWSW